MLPHVKKKNKSVKFNPDDLKQLSQDFEPKIEENNILKISEKIPPDPDPNPKEQENENTEKFIPPEKNPFLKSALGKMISRKIQNKKSTEEKETENKPILKSLRSNENNDGELKNMLVSRSQFKKNLKVKKVIIDKDWLKSNNNYDNILLNAFYLIDIKKNLQKTKVY